MTEKRMPLGNPEAFRPQQETKERSPEAKRMEGVRIVRVDEVAERFAAMQHAEGERARLTEEVARQDVALARETAAKFQNPTLRAKLLAEAGPKERVAQKSAADRETAILLATEAGAVVELVKLEKDPAAFEQWERGLEKEAAQLSAELKQSPENTQAKARLAEIKVKLDTAMDLPAAKHRLLEWNRAQQQPRQLAGVEAMRMAA